MTAGHFSRRFLAAGASGGLPVLRRAT